MRNYQSCVHAQGVSGSDGRGSDRPLRGLPEILTAEGLHAQGDCMHSFGACDSETLLACAQ